FLRLHARSCGPSRLQPGQHLRHHRFHTRHRTLEDLRVRLRRLTVPADLPHELQRRRPHLVRCRRLFRPVQRLNTSTHRASPPFAVHTWYFSAGPATLLAWQQPSSRSASPAAASPSFPSTPRRLPQAASPATGSATASTTAAPSAPSASSPSRISAPCSPMVTPSSPGPPARTSPPAASIGRASCPVLVSVSANR